MTSRQIDLAKTDALEARGLALENGAESEYGNEARDIENELEARWFARHDDDRVKQAMGCDIPAWDR
jgi:hypothetical protein